MSMKTRETTPTPPESIIGIDVKDMDWLRDKDFEGSPRGGPAVYVALLIIGLGCFAVAYIVGLGQ